MITLSTLFLDLNQSMDEYRDRKIYYQRYMYYKQIPAFPLEDYIFNLEENDVSV